MTLDDANMGLSLFGMSLIRKEKHTMVGDIWVYYLKKSNGFIDQVNDTDMTLDEVYAMVMRNAT